MEYIVHIGENAEAAAAYTRDWLVENIRLKTNRSDESFVLSLSGGSTPQRLYQMLAELPPGRIDWQRVLLMWGDERNVSQDHKDSNYLMVKENLLDHISIPEANVLAVPNPGGSADDAARRYEQVLKDRLPLDRQGIPIVDCVLLGIGDDVHTASLFPQSPALGATERLVRENWVAKLDCWRITTTAHFINQARQVAFLICGEGKQQAINTIWHGPRDPQQFPAQFIRPSSGQIFFMLDRSAMGDNELPANAHLPRS